VTAFLEIPFGKEAAAFFEIKIPLKQRRPLFWEPFPKGAAAFFEIKIPLKQRRPLFWKSPLGKRRPLANNHMPNSENGN